MRTTDVLQSQPDTQLTKLSRIQEIAQWLKQEHPQDQEPTYESRERKLLGLNGYYE